jgi:hypothetical protein
MASGVGRGSPASGQPPPQKTGEDATEWSPAFGFFSWLGSPGDWFPACAGPRKNKPAHGGMHGGLLRRSDDGVLIRRPSASDLQDAEKEQMLRELSVARARARMAEEKLKDLQRCIDAQGGLVRKL